MTHNWKPGDVAFVILDGRSYAAVRGNGVWRDKWFIGGPERGSRHGWSDAQIDTVRPLLVIDPEDREQVERLTVALFAEVGAADLPDGYTANEVQAALRSLLEPEPDEPTRLGAVAQSDDGSTWVRAHLYGSKPWVRSAFVNESCGWADLPRRITVLSEGWQESES